MSTVQINPAWVPLGRQLKAAIKARGVNRQKLADTLKVHYGTVSNYTCGRALPSLAVLAKLQTALRLDAETVGMIEALHAARKHPPTPAGPSLGPARRAVALHAARTPVQILTPSQPRPDPRAGVFGMEVQADGTMNVWLRATLPLERGTQLLRTLLDFDLINQTPEPPTHGR